MKEPAANWTWDDVLEMAKKLTNPAKQQFGMRFPPVGNLAGRTVEVLRSWGADYYTKDLTRATINSPAAVEALQFMADLRNKHHVVARPGELPKGNDFHLGHSAMDYQWQGYVLRVKQAKVSYPWDVAPLPRGPKGAVNIVGSTGYSIPKGAANPEAGFEVVRFMVDEQVQKDMQSNGRWTTPRRSYLKYSLPSDGVPAHYQSAIIDRLLKGEGFPVPAAYGAMLRVFQEETAKVWTGERPVRQALDAVQAQWDALLKTEKR